MWPALTPRVAAASGRPRWGQAILGELFVWILGDAVLIFAATLNFKLAGIVFASSFVAYFAVVPLIKQRAGAQR